MYLHNFLVWILMQITFVLQAHLNPNLRPNQSFHIWPLKIISIVDRHTLQRNFNKKSIVSFSFGFGLNVNVLRKIMGTVIHIWEITPHQCSYVTTHGNMPIRSNQQVIQQPNRQCVPGGHNWDNYHGTLSFKPNHSFEDPTSVDSIYRSPQSPNES